jgi:ubiquinone/menaquinone biosynthesis C-methylase UbiE
VTTDSKARPERRQFQQRVVEFAKQNAWFGRSFNAISWRRSQTVVSLFKSSLPASGRLLDIGTGTGHVAALLQAPDRMVVACDVMDLLMLPYVLADGTRLPFLDATFDAVLLVTVLHHVPKADHARFFNEARRVLRPGGRLILMEDTFHGEFELNATKLFDSIMNGEFSGHPHANRTLAEWMELMTQSGFQVDEHSEHVSWYGLFRIRHGIVIGVLQ